MLHFSASLPICLLITQLRSWMRFILIWFVIYLHLISRLPNNWYSFTKISQHLHTYTHMGRIEYRHTYKKNIYLHLSLKRNDRLQKLLIWKLVGLCLFKCGRRIIHPHPKMSRTSQWSCIHRAAHKRRLRLIWMENFKCVSDYVVFVNLWKSVPKFIDMINVF